MGDAYTAIADDESTLFYNPAALGRHQGLSLYPLATNIEVPDVVDTNFSIDNFGIGLNDQFENFPSEPEDIANKLIGLPLYLKLAGNAGFKFLNFGMNFFANSKTQFTLENAIHPKLNIDYRLDRGFITGAAIKFGNGGKGRNPSGHITSLGASFKIMNRQGLESSTNLFGPELIDLIENSNSYKDLRNRLGFSKGSGHGFDLGIEHNYYKGRTRYTLGLSMLDISDTNFSTEEGNNPIPSQEQSLNFGSSFNQDFGLFNYSLAFDLHNLIDQSSDFGSQIHLGARLRLPIVSLYTGWNGGYMSWGLQADIMFLRLGIGFYGVEVGRKYLQRESERAVITLSLAEFSFSSF